MRRVCGRDGGMRNMLRAGRRRMDRPLRLVTGRLGALVRRVRSPVLLGSAWFDRLPLGMRLLRPLRVGALSLGMRLRLGPLRPCRP